MHWEASDEETEQGVVYKEERLCNYQEQDFEADD